MKLEAGQVWATHSALDALPEFEKELLACLLVERVFSSTVEECDCFWPTSHACFWQRFGRVIFATASRH